MKIVFMGTPEFAVASLKALLSSKYELLAVVTGQDKPSGRGRKLQPTPVKILADKHGIKTYQPKSLKSKNFYDEMSRIEADLYVVCAFRILSPELISLPEKGAINIHTSLLPKYRGAAPINHAIINGESETGLTAFYLQKSVDTGNIILQENIQILTNDTYDSLHDRMADKSGQFLLKTLELIEQGKVKAIKQDDAQATPAPKLYPEDGMIDFNQPAINVSNFIRGMSSTPGAFSYFRGEKIKILNSCLSENTGESQAKPGEIVQTKKKLLVRCSDATIELLRLLPAGKKEMDGISFANGFRVKIGEKFEIQALKSENSYG